MLQSHFQMVTFSGTSIVRFFLFFVYLLLLMTPGFVYAVDTDGDGIENAIDPDDDNDGMPDTFENTFGLDSLLPADSVVDSDSDGYDSLSEFRAGTSPVDSNEHPGNVSALHYKVLANESSGLFGGSVSIEGDTAIIGASYDSTTAFRAGAAFIYVRDVSGTWNQQAKLLATDGASYDYFGASVALSGDIVVIGATGDDDKGTRSGSVYIFARDTSGVWHQQAKLVPEDGWSSNYFGNSVAVSGGSIVIGSWGDSDNGISSGSAYVYMQNAQQNWVQQAKLLPNDGASNDAFGVAVALDVDTALIGAQSDVHTGTLRGSAYIFVRDVQGQWSQYAKLIGPDPIQPYGFGKFGASTTLEGDVAAIGAPGVTIGNTGWKSGVAYVFVRDASGTWIRQQELSSPVLGHDFGDSVSMSQGRILVGQRSGSSDSGSAFIYSDADHDGIWSLVAQLTPNDRTWNDKFGIGVALDADYALVGSSNDDDNGSGTGSGYFFDLNDSDGDGVVHTIDNCRGLTNPDQADLDSDNMGDTCDPDIDGDGVNNPADQFPLDVTEWVDSDDDGIGDNADFDDDNDGVPDWLDAFPYDATEAFDTDYDGIGNNADTDDDNDGLSDSDEVIAGSDSLLMDTDGDGLIDGYGGLINIWLVPYGVDIDGDGFADGEQDYGTSPLLADTDGDQLQDGLEVANGTSPTDPESWPYLTDGDLAPFGNPDGQINAGDILIAIHLTHGSLTSQSLQLAHGDMNEDGKIDTADVLLITRLVLGQ